jgi:signal transduction histidine kinase
LTTLYERSTFCEDCLKFMLWQWAHALPTNGRMIVENTTIIRSVLGQDSRELQRLSIYLDRIDRIAKEIVELDSPFQMEEVVLDELLQKRTQERFADISGNGIRLEADLNSSRAIVWANYVWLRRLLDTFIDNSVEAMMQPLPNTSSVIPQQLILIRSEIYGEWLKMIITDTGPGFDQLVIDSLFEQPRDLQPQGRGRGLYIARLLVEIYGGKIEITREQTVGATVIVWLPILFTSEGKEK